MKKINKKTVLIIGLILIAIFGFVIYLLPMSLSDIATQDNTLIFTKVDMGVKDGQPYNESTNYNNITDEQKQDILLLLSDFSYTRNMETFFSDGSMSNNKGDGYFYIFIYNGTDLKNTVTLAYDDEISISNKIYTMKNSSDFINQILDILNE